MNGDLVKTRLLELGMSREQLAAEMGVSIATVWNMIRGNRINERNLHRAAKALGLEIGALQRATKQRKPA